jgi:orotidine-5'-phosphate decarboxylase
VQDFADAEGSPLSAHVAGMVDGWAQRPQLVGSRGYSCVGAVVAPRNVELTMRLREMMPRCIFLVPGYGAQGATADHVKRCFKPDGTGALVNASRSVIYAFSNVEYQRRGDGSWEKCIELACDDFARDVARVLGM